ncbi:GLPGLI family protein [Bizionia myxarmorum]|uniref:GLPGLI family protein n=1 Tax=Bizionia myxarmorum TaxID=291186 RepID=A0A5D0RE38_9FLAO|nr:GLPGLI family protein [Bizionia myxarmorum]TYB78814.1 GLPGLI family protein [Bizionia myxarmorum]
MKKYYYIIFLLLVCLNGLVSFAQSNQLSGTVTYTVSLKPFNDFMKERFKKEGYKSGLQIFNDMAKTASNFECKLSFNRFQSKFELENAMGLGDIDRKMFLAMRAVTQGTYYSNLMTQKQVLQDNSSQELFIESKLERITWQQTKDIKKIGDYICYKAIAIKELINAEKITIEVWYTPQIPVAFGPKEYVGSLPGIVLEYKDNVVHFVAKKVILNPKHLKVINWPTNKTISKEDYKNQNEYSFSTLRESHGKD